jgi:hypothetical protein
LGELLAKILKQFLMNEENKTELKAMVVELIDKLTAPVVGSSDKTSSVKFNLDDTHTDTESDKKSTSGASIRIVKIECVDGKTTGNYTLRVKTDTDGGDAIDKTYTVGVGEPVEPGDKVKTNFWGDTKTTITCTGLDGQTGQANFLMTYHLC